MSPLLQDWLRPPSVREHRMHSIMEDDWGGNKITPRCSRDDPNRLRVVFGNINGLQIGQTSSANHKLRQICQVIRQLKIDHLGLAEINCDTQQFKVTDCIRTTIKELLGHSAITYASSALQSNTMFKPGGTMSIAYDDITGRVVETSKDSLGRWSVIKYRGKDNRALTIVSAYQVCSSTSDSGTTAFAQQELLLRQSGKSDPHPRRNFRADFVSFLSKCRSKGDSLIVMGDFNEDITRSDWLFSYPDLSLVDIIGDHHPATKHLCTYQGGSTRLDFALVSSDIKDCVMECGYFPFRSHFSSDHRFLFLDLDLKSCLGSLNSALGPPQLRDFTPKDPKALRLYIKTKAKYLQDHNFFDRLSKLQEDDIFDPVLLEDLDAILTRASLVAGEKCRRKRRHWFSLPLHIALEKKAILQTLLTGYRKAKDFAAMKRVAEARISRGKIEMALPTSMEEVKLRLKAITKEIQEIVQESKSYRTQFLEDRAADRARNGEISKQKALESLIKAERDAEQWSRIKRALKPDSLGGLSSISVPSSWPKDEEGFLSDTIEDPKRCVSWRTIDSPKEIEFYIRMRNRLHFGQAQGTPFTVPPLTEYFDWAANSWTSELVLEGDYSNRELQMLESLLLQHCKRESADLVGNEISKEEFRGRLRAWDERTTTSPSGLHLGHAKALITKIQWISDEDKQLIDDQTALFNAHLDIINYALRHGHSMERWKQVVNVMIEKEKGNDKIHKLRVIHLYEFDFGAMLGILWRKMMDASEKRGTINDGQFGGRKGREAKDLAFLEEIKNDICQGSRKPLINFDNDAASCYDRIIPSLASLIGRSKGLHYNIALVHASTLQHAKFKLKTALGVSEESYSHCGEFPIYGTGQGSTNSPIIWIIISSKLFDLHAKNAYGASFSTPDKSVMVSFSIVGFVDDSNCQTNQFLVDSDVPDEELIALAEYDAQYWSKLLWLSGGYLELPKCSYHLISFDFNEDGSPFMKGGRIGRPICVRDEKLNEEVSIPAKSVYDPHKTLGHFKAPAGKCQVQARVLQDKADMLADRMMRFQCTHVEAQLTYRALYLGWVSYVLGQCTLAQADLRKIESKVSRVFMVKCGFARTMPIEIRYGPRRLAGAGQVRLYTIQGEGQVQNIVKHWRADSTPGKATKCAIAWGQFQAGIGSSILYDTSTPLPHLEQRFVRSARDFLASIDARLELYPTFVPPLIRENDFYIMDVAIQCDSFTEKHLKLINFCRMYLQVTTVAEITDPGGKFLESAAIMLKAHMLPSKSTYLRINQRRPGEKFCQPWKDLCRVISLKLRNHSLGRWVGDPTECRRRWHVYYDPGTGQVFTFQGNNILSYSKDSNGIFRRDSSGEQWDRLPASAIPVQGKEIDDGSVAIIETSIVPRRQVRSPPIAATFDEYIASLPGWEKELLSNINFLESGPFELIERFKQSGRDDEIVVTLVGDGSGGNGSMAFGWNLSLPDGRIMVEGSGPAFGAKESSYRSEGYALLASVRFVYRWFRFCQVHPDWKIVYYADNSSILLKVKDDMTFTDFWPNTTLEVDWDIRNEIKQTLQELGNQFEVKHVKGHQDDHLSEDQLSTASKLNIRADELAGNFRKWNNTIRPLVPRLESNAAQLIIGEMTITGNFRSAIRDAASERDLILYTLKKFHWTMEQYHSIDWEAFTSAVRATPHRADQVTKLVFEWTPTNKLMHKYDPKTSPACPRCQAEVETVGHVIRCSEMEVDKLRKLLLKNIRSKCVTMKTKPALLSLLIVALEAWFRNEILEWEEYPSDTQELIRNQTMVGWDQLFRGRFVRDWARIQDCYLGSLPKSAKKKGLSGTRWVTAVIRVIWTHFFEMWESRNQVVHGCTPQESFSKVKRKLLAELKLIHADRLKYVPVDRTLLLADDDQGDKVVEEYVRNHLPSTIRNWINWHAPFFKASAKEAQTKAVSMVRPLTTFFRRMSRQGDEPKRTVAAPEMSWGRAPRFSINRSITEFFGVKTVADDSDKPGSSRNPGGR